MTSASVRGRSSLRRLLMFERTKRRSSGVTCETGLSTLVSVVPMQVRALLKNQHKSKAKKAKRK